MVPSVSNNHINNVLTHSTPISEPAAFKGLLEYIRYLVSCGGPEVQDYAALNTTLDALYHYLRFEPCAAQHVSSIKEAFGDVLSLQTTQGHAYRKPHGYPGDYEIIDKIYQRCISGNPHLANWDRFFQSHSAAQAVRNRVSYFLEQIWIMKTQHPQEARVLNVASGPGRDMYESLKIMGQSNIFFECIDQDKNALDYARTLCHNFLSNINFIQQNVFRFTTQKTYQLIWSAGLFDYFSDGLFKRVLKRLLCYVAHKGRIVIGNFSENNPSKSYMDLLEWNLQHRSEAHLRALAEECGAPPENISIEQEPEGVNLFLKIVRP